MLPGDKRNKHVKKKERKIFETTHRMDLPLARKVADVSIIYFVLVYKMVTKNNTHTLEYIAI